MKKRTITWMWENPEAQALFAEWVTFPDPSQTAHEVERMTTLLDLRSPMSILDVGCGTGRHALELARRGYRVTGIDVAKSYLEQARRESARSNLAISFRLQRGSELADEQVYEAALAVNHTPGFLSADEWSTHLHRIKAALKAGGRFLLSLAGPKIAPSARAGKTKEWAEKSGRYIMSEKHIQEGYRYETGVIIDTISGEIIEYHEKQRAFSLEVMRSELQGAGFMDIRCLANLEGAPATDDSFGVFVARKGA
jgi:SAM-dependent methyltransferase